MTKPLPYPIPGPAGGLTPSFPTRHLMSTPATPPNTMKAPSKQQTTTNKQLFMTGLWPYIPTILHIHPNVNELKTSLAILRRLAILNLKPTTEIRLPVLVTCIRWLSDDASVMLSDPTANVNATIHANAMDKFSNTNTPIDEHVVLLLKNVVPFSSVEELGFRVDVSRSVHLYLTEENIEKVIVYDQNLIKNKFGNVKLDPWCLEHPEYMYTKYARAPPVPKHNIRPNRLSPSVGSRPMMSATPLQPRNHKVSPSAQQQHNNNQNTVSNGIGIRPNNMGTTASNIPRKRPFTHPVAAGLYNNNQNNDMNNQNKRPTPASAFRPPNRPTPITQSHRPIHLPVQHQQSNISGPVISDDHLDSLLGDFDIDAIIDTHRKSQAQPSTQQPTTPILHHTTQGRPGMQPTDRNRNGNTNSSRQVQSDSNSGSINNTTNSASNSNSVLSSGVQDDVIQSLFEGLSGDDFPSSL